MQVRYVGIDLQSGAALSAFYLFYFQNWQGLRRIHLGLEGPGLNIGRRLEFYPLREGDYKVFMEDYRHVFKTKISPNVLDDKTAIDIIKKKHMEGFPRLKGFLERAGMTELSLVTVLNP